MSGKLKMLLGFGVGYVLGARAGRKRYDQLVAQARRVWHDPWVQAKAEEARQMAGEMSAEAGQALIDKAADAAAEPAAEETPPASQNS